jgi:hypothetical protein
MKPGDFLLGVLDFFAVLLPGSLATWIVTRYVPPDDLARALSFGVPSSAAPDPLVSGTAFLLSSYVLGHFVFMAGSRLDDSYDRWRERVKPRDTDKVYQAAEKARGQLTPELAKSEFTLLKWAKTYIQVQASQARSEIDRLDADSKFFRSLVVVSVALTLHFLLGEHSTRMALASLLMTLLAYRRYRDRRWSMTELSYGSAVIVFAARATPSARPVARDEPKD